MSETLENVTVEKAASFINAANKYLKENPSERSHLTYRLRKLLPKAKEALDKKSEELEELTEDIKVELASRETREDGKEGNIIEESIPSKGGRGFITRRKYTPEKLKEVNTRVRALNAKFLTKSVAKELTLFSPLFIEIPSNLSFEYLAPFYGIIFKALSEEEELELYLKKESKDE